MANLVVVGAQWGDEGKGKIVDALTERADVVVRFQGGPNAGHTVVAGGHKRVLHLLPSGILHPGKSCVIGSGVVLDPRALLKELDDLRAQGALPEDLRLVISENAQVIMPWHLLLDALRERASAALAIGTTGRGIGPAYEDKVARRGVRVRDLLRPASLAARIAQRLPSAEAEIRSLARQLGEAPPELDPEALAAEHAALGARLAPHVADASLFLAAALREGRTILFEGAQGTLLDVDHGTYPFVTSSNTVAGNAAVGAGVGPTAIDAVLGVSKVYATRVGAGPFPTELDGPLGDRLRQAGGEFGSTTGRPRRCGWLDLVALRYAVRVNGLDSLVLTKLDVLSGLSPLRIAVAYRIEGRTVDELPGDPDELAAAAPVWEELPGWTEDLGGAARWEDLPGAVHGLVRRIEELCGIPAVGISVGADRSRTFFRADPFVRSGRGRG